MSATEVKNKTKSAAASEASNGAVITEEMLDELEWTRLFDATTPEQIEKIVQLAEADIAARGTVPLRFPKK